MYVYYPYANSLIITVEKLKYSPLRNYVSYIKKAGIRVLCMPLNLIKYSSHLKENIKIGTSDFLTNFIEACLFYMLVVLHFTNNSR